MRTFVVISRRGVLGRATVLATLGGLSGAVSQAGVLDLVDGARRGLGAGAVTDLLGGPPELVPERSGCSAEPVAVPPPDRLTLRAHLTPLWPVSALLQRRCPGRTEAGLQLTSGLSVDRDARSAGSRTHAHVTGTPVGGASPTASGTTPPEPVQSKIVIPDSAVLALLGSRDENLRVTEDLLAADVHVRGNEVTLSGSPADVAFAERAFGELLTLARRGQQLGPDAVRRTVAMLTQGDAESPAEVLSLDILSRRGRTIRPKTLNQKRYVDAIDAYTIVFGIGPAGTGKTYLAMAKAVQTLQAKQVNRIILTRPAVEAGERLGFLPGTLYEKIDPYLRPLYDALHDMLDPESIPKLMAAGTIEVAPLAYMRGRTLNDAFIILDEAQNTTPEQIKMFLTRLGFGSKVVVTGDVTQIDLPAGQVSGLRVVQQILDHVEDVHFAYLSSADVVRHRLVTDIVDAYARWDAIQEASGAHPVPNRADRRRRR